MAHEKAKFPYPMVYPYKEEIIYTLEHDIICFAQWLGPSKVIFGHRHRLFIRDMDLLQTVADPLEEIEQSKNINCMRANPSQTRLAVGSGTFVIVYDIPILRHYGKIYSEGPFEVDEVCWVNDDTFAIVNNQGQIIIRVWADGRFTEGKRKAFIHPYLALDHSMFKQPSLLYHSGYDELVYLSHMKEPILYVMNADLTVVRFRSFKRVISPLYDRQNRYDVPILVDVHPSNPHYFVATRKKIIALNAKTLQDVFTFDRNNKISSFSIAGNILTYGFYYPPCVSFWDFENNRDSAFVLLSQANFRVRSDTRRRKHGVITSKPLIKVHTYSNDRTKIFCGGMVKTGPSSAISSHSAIWEIQIHSVAGPSERVSIYKHDS